MSTTKQKMEAEQPREMIARTLCEKVNGTSRWDDLQEHEREDYRRIAGESLTAADRARHSEYPTAEQSLTYHFRLALDNDAEVYRERCEIVRDHLAARDVCPFCDAVGCEHCEEGFRARYPHQLGDRLKAWAEDLTGLGVGTFDVDALAQTPYPDLTREMLSTALAWVNWEEVATSYIAENGE